MTLQDWCLKLSEGEKHAEQINGREGETATFFWRCLLNFSGLGGGFAPRHLNRCVFLDRRNCNFGWRNF